MEAILSFTPTPIITNPPDIIAYVLRHFASTPKSATNTYYDTTISVAYILSLYGENRSRTATEVKNALEVEFSRIWPTAGRDIVVDTQNAGTEAPSGYIIVISVSIDIDGVIYTVDNNIRVTDNLLRLSIDSTATL